VAEQAAGRMAGQVAGQVAGGEDTGLAWEIGEVLALVRDQSAAADLG
jgi:hypothetical protein